MPKEYKTGLATTQWNMGRIPLLIILSVATLLLTFFTRNIFVFCPFILLLPAFFGACIGGSVYGALIAGIAFTLSLIVSPSAEFAIFSLTTIGVVAFFGSYVRMGFFFTTKGVWLGIFLNALLDVFLKVPVFFAFHGLKKSYDFRIIPNYYLLKETSIHPIIMMALYFFLLSFLELTITLWLVRFAFKKLPDSLAARFDIPEYLPSVNVIGDNDDEDFAGESDKLKEKAQQKIHEIHAKETKEEDKKS